MKRIEPIYNHLTQLQRIIETLPQTNAQQQQISQTFAELQSQLEDLQANICPIADHVQCQLSGEALRQSEERFRVALKNSPITVFSQDTDLRYTWIYNPIDEFTSEAIVGYCDHDLFPAKSAQLLTQLKQQVLATGVSTRQEVTIALGQTVRTFDLTIEPLLNFDGTLIGITCASTEVTHLKQVEAEMRSLNAELERRVFERTEALQESEARLRTVLDGVHGAISSFRVFDNLSWIYDYHSPGCEVVFGYSAEEMTSDPSLWTSRVLPEDWESKILPILAAIQAEQTITTEYRFYHQDGSLRWASSTTVSRRDPNQPCWLVTAIDMDITDRKQMEAALRASEQRYATLAASAPVGIFRDDGKGNCIYVNDRCSQITGYVTPGRVEQCWQQICHPDFRDDIMREWQQAVRRGDMFESEFCIQHPDGTLKWIYCQATPEVDSNRRIVGYIGTLIDLTDRKAIEKALQQSEERYRLIAQNFPNGTLKLFDHDCRYLLADGQELVRLGLSCDFFEGKTLWETLPPETSATLEPHYRAALTGQHSVFEMQYQGEHYLVNTVPLKNATGEVIAGMSSSQNITSLKLTEAALRESEERFRQLAENIEGVFWLVDLRQRKLIYVSPAYEKIWGRSFGKSLDYQIWYSTLYPDDLERVMAALLATRDGAVEIEYRIVRPDGTLRWIRDKGFPIRDSSGEVYRCGGVAEDITDRKSAESALRESESRLKASLAEKEVLLREIHHRVKNNLQVIASLLRLQSRRVSDPAIQAVLEDSENRVISMALVHENLYQSQDLSQVNFSQYVHSLAANLLQTYRGSGQAQLQVTLDKQIRLGLEKAVPCGLIMNELLTNALKHGYSLSSNGEVSVAMTLNEQKVVLCVTNKGDLLPTDFDLSQVKSMGLRLVMVLAEQLEGTIEVERGDFTKFKVVFPYAE